MPRARTCHLSTHPHKSSFCSGLMTSTEYALDDNAAKTILNSLDFPYGIFAIVTIRLIPSSGFFDVFNSNDYKIIRKGFFNLVESLFKEHFRCSVIPGEKQSAVHRAEFPNPLRLSLCRQSYGRSVL